MKKDGAASLEAGAAAGIPVRPAFKDSGKTIAGRKDLQMAKKRNRMKMIMEVSC